MTGLGERLKEARKKKGYTLEDVQEITKIQKRYLANIEEEDYSNMPGAFYVRAFIKQYAEAVDIDPEEVLAMYRDSSREEEVEKKEEEQQVVKEPLAKPTFEISSNMREWLPKIGVAVGIIAIIAIIYFVYKASAPTADTESDINSGEEVTVQQPSGNDDTEGQVVVEEEKEEKEEKDSTPAKKENEKDKVEKEDGKEEEKEEKEEEESTKEGTLELQSTAGETSTYRLTEAEQFVLTIRTSDESWIGVTDENGQEHLPEGARVLAAGDEATVDMSNSKRARIRVGRSQVTEIYINGEKFNFPTEKITQNIVIEYDRAEKKEE